MPRIVRVERSESDGDEKPRRPSRIRIIGRPVSPESRATADLVSGTRAATGRSVGDLDLLYGKPGTFNAPIPPGFGRTFGPSENLNGIAEPLQAAIRHTIETFNSIRTGKVNDSLERTRDFPSTQALCDELSNLGSTLQRVGGRFAFVIGDASKYQPDNTYLYAYIIEAPTTDGNIRYFYLPPFDRVAGSRALLNGEYFDVPTGIENFGGISRFGLANLPEVSIDQQSRPSTIHKGAIRVIQK